MKKLAPSTKKKCEIQKRDRAIFEMIWKWKGLSTSAIARKFFSDETIYAGYSRLMRLRREGYVKPVLISEGFVWSLGPKGFRTIREELPFLSNEGFSSEYPTHDYFCTALQLGEWLDVDTKEITAFSEQELRRIPQDNWPKWVPRASEGGLMSDKHRPDGFSLFKTGPHQAIAAFEVELNVKTASRYERVVNYYNSLKTVSIIFWLVKDSRDIQKLKNIFEAYGITRWSRHHFLTAGEFKAKGWMAWVAEGDFKGKTILEILDYDRFTKVLPIGYKRNTLCLLDSRKRLMKLKTSALCQGIQNP